MRLKDIIDNIANRFIWIGQIRKDTEDRYSYRVVNYDTITDQYELEFLDDKHEKDYYSAKYLICDQLIEEI